MKTKRIRHHTRFARDTDRTSDRARPVALSSGFQLHRNNALASRYNLKYVPPVTPKRASRRYLSNSKTREIIAAKEESTVLYLHQSHNGNETGHHCVLMHHITYDGHASS
ncbi:hypothetical protein HPB50_016267 [Hyalomma asiaticum]|uniref:Uncharacterized protein n=1 Tax=Hyalomma asiaticum TaxID=266040 RepID=A0ACB7TIU7_HYAAI|nr:hypothetical protein HPB50_016267 [Hyalomma asiaticum]